MGKTQFQYDETGNTYYYVFLTFLGLILIPSTYYFWPFQKEPEICLLYTSDAADE